MNYSQYEKIKCLRFFDKYKKKTKLKKMINSVKKDLLKLIFCCIIFIYHVIIILNLNKLFSIILIFIIVIIIRIYLGVKTSIIKKITKNIDFLNIEKRIILENINNLNELKLIKNLLILNKSNREGEYSIIILFILICLFISFNINPKIYELLITNVIEILLLFVITIIFIPIIKYLYDNNENDVKRLLIKIINIIVP